MTTQIPWLTLITFSPLLGVMILLFIPQTKVQHIRGIGMISTFISLVLSASLYTKISAGTLSEYMTEKLNWISIPLGKSASRAVGELISYDFHINYQLGLDRITLVLVFMSAIIFMTAMMASAQIKKRLKTYVILVLILQIGAFGVFMARDVFFFFMFFELTLVTTFFLIGIWGNMACEKAANQFLIINSLGAVCLLMGFIILTLSVGLSVDPLSMPVEGHYIVSGDYDTILQNITQDNIQPHLYFLSDAINIWVCRLFFIAFAIKLALFPFHTWMIKVQAEAAAPVGMIHSSVLLSMGAYGFLRFVLPIFPEYVQMISVLLQLLGVINVLYGAVLATVQQKFRLVLAYATMSQMGIVILGLASLNELGFQGALFQLISSGLILALLFLILGTIFERTKTTELSQFGGLLQIMPFIGGMLLVASLALLGLPGLSGFIGEFITLIGVFKSMKVTAMLGVVGLIFTAIYMLRSLSAMTFKEAVKPMPDFKDARVIEALPMIILVAVIVVLGIYPSVVTEPLRHGFDLLLQMIKAGGGVV